ncbi:hypothetical protein Syun_023206 [Stephania yunnanensis]|uniref:Uncharacterized protein n=1 Tax=Stephania yunnanensis TaxID=152371 RepID=A0AAP0FB40_9MAGN
MSPSNTPTTEIPKSHGDEQIPSSSPTTEIPKSHGDAQIPSSSLLYTLVSPILSELREPPPPSIAASPHRQPSPFLESSRTLAIATPDPSPPHQSFETPKPQRKRRSLKRSIRATTPGELGFIFPSRRCDRGLRRRIPVTIPKGMTVFGLRGRRSRHSSVRYHARLSIAGNCRMCLVEVEKSPKPVASAPCLALPGFDSDVSVVVVGGAKALDRVKEEVNALVNLCDKVECVISEELKEIGWNRRIRLDPVLCVALYCELELDQKVELPEICVEQLRCESWRHHRLLERLKHELEVTTQRQEIVSCFLRDYQLSNEEIHALREEDLSENFFKALSHVQEIHANCKILLRTHHQQGLADTVSADSSDVVLVFSFTPPMDSFTRCLELMDMMAVYQEGAYERLCRLRISSPS